MKKLTLTEITWNRHGITAKKLGKALGMSERNVRRLGKEIKLEPDVAVKISEFVEKETGQHLMPWEYTNQYKGLRDLITRN